MSFFFFEWLPAQRLKERELYHVPAVSFKYPSRTFPFVKKNIEDKIRAFPTAYSSFSKDLTSRNMES